MKKGKFLIMLVVICFQVTFLSSCKEDLDDNGFAKSSDLDASFKVTKLSENLYYIASTNNKYLYSLWDYNDGIGFVKGLNRDTLFLPDKGSYVIKHKVLGAGAVYSAEISETITVATTDLDAGNILEGGKFASNEDTSKWTIDNLGGTITFEEGWAKFTNNPGSWGQAALQQPITVVAGKKYSIDFSFQTKGVYQGWFKVYACTTKPTKGSEYKGDILVAEVNIWTDTPAPQSGKFSKILNKDSGTKTGNTVTFATSGIIYLSLQCGANDLKDGVSISNIEFRGSK